MKVKLNAYAELACLVITVGAKNTRERPRCKPLCFHHDYVTMQVATINSQMIMNANVYMIRNNHLRKITNNSPQMVLNNNPYLSGEANDEDDLLIDLNPCEPFKEGRNVAVALYCILIIA